MNGTAIENWPPKDVEAELLNQIEDAWDTSIENVDVVEVTPDATVKVKLRLVTERLVT